MNVYKYVPNLIFHQFLSSGLKNAVFYLVLLGGPLLPKYLSRSL